VKLKMKAMLTSAALLAVPAVAQAQGINPFPGFYLGAGGGAAWQIGNTPNASTWTGWAVGGKAGYDFVGPRVEVEVGYGQIPTSANIPGTAINGKVGSLNVMGNLYYDFMPASVITPYIGAGAGVAFVDSNASLGSTQFAYQGMLGVAYNVSDQLRFMVEGRYFGTTNPSVNVPGLGTVSYSNNIIMALAGVQFKFGAPAAAPPPPSAPPVAPPSFMVFFDWDRSNLSQQALNTIRQAAAAFKSKGNARITATGHTDTSGPEAYNMALSLRRANAVKDALVREGVPAQAIAVIGRGEQGLLVQTGDGVREPQNRRVEIVIQ
jgi:OmpA-OmpF porin, OOP family